MSNRVGRGLAIVCMVFGFFYVGYVCWPVLTWTTTVTMITLGIFFYCATFRHLPVAGQRAVIIACVLWSIYIYFAFVLAGTINLHQEGNHDPVWIQDVAPFIFACTPLAVLWGARFGYMGLKG